MIGAQINGEAPYTAELASGPTEQRRREVRLPRGYFEPFGAYDFVELRLSLTLSELEAA